MNPYLPFPAHTLVCTACKKEYRHDEAYRFRCSCGSPYGIKDHGVSSIKKIFNEGNFFERYWQLWGIPRDTPMIGIGEGDTPIKTFAFRDRWIKAKLEYLSPTGSYKDRGAAVMVSMLMAAGVKEIIEDSSGNAGGAIAAYSSAANIDCTIYCPDKASGAKLSFIRSCGAKLMRIEGARERAAERALEKAEEMVYGSHVWNPWFMTGVRSIAYEIAQQSDILPDEIIMPLGNGALLLGIYQGFKDLIEARVIDRVPALIGVQADEVAPIYQAWTGGTGTHKGSTIAEGIANAQPPRANEIIEAIRDSRGQIISVSEEEIKNSWQEALSRGMLIEPTSAVVLAAEMKIAPQKNRLHMLTGSLLKTPDMRQQI